MIDLLQQGDVSVAEIGVVIVDEADRMADMGFLPQVEWILRQIEGRHQTLLFSATLDGVVDGLIKRYQHDPAMHEVQSDSVTVEEMTHHFLHVHQLDKVKVAARIPGAERTIMFTRTKPGADRLARDLGEGGACAPPPSTATCARRTVRSRWPTSPPASFPSSSPPTCGPQPAHRRPGHRDPLRPAVRSQDVPPPLRPHRPRR
jgi:hypothetical protein